MRLIVVKKRSTDNRADPASYQLVQQHHFWQTVILSPAALRRNWDLDGCRSETGTRATQRDKFITSEKAMERIPVGFDEKGKRSILPDVLLLN